MAFSVQHTKCPNSRASEFGDCSRPYWYHLEAYSDREKALRRARQYGLDNGGYVCVKDADGTVIYGTDPAQLNRAIVQGINKHFRSVSA